MPLAFPARFSRWQGSALLQPSDATISSARAAGLAARSGGKEHLRLDEDQYQRTIGVKSASSKQIAEQPNPSAQPANPPSEQPQHDVGSAAEATSIDQARERSSQAQPRDAELKTARDASGLSTDTAPDDRQSSGVEEELVPNGRGPFTSLNPNIHVGKDAQELVSMLENDTKEAKSREESLSPEVQAKENSLNRLAEILSDESALTQLNQTPESAKLAKLDELNSTISKIETSDR